MKAELAQKKLDQLKQKQKARSDFWRPAPGENYVRFLPRWDGDYDGELYRETAYHRNLGPEKDRSAVCLRAEGQEKCPVCEVISELYKTKRKEDADLAKTLKAQTRILYNIIDLNDPDKGVQIYTSGVEVQEQVLRYVNNPKYGAIDNPNTGRNCTLNYQEQTKSGFPSTSVVADPDTTPLADMEWLEKLNDLNALVKPMSYEELHALLWGEEAPAKESSPPKDEAKKPAEKKPTPPCFEKAKFSKDDEECVKCDYATPCEQKKKPKEAPKEQPKPAPAGSPKGESLKDMLSKLKK